MENMGFFDYELTYIFERISNTGNAVVFGAGKAGQEVVRQLQSNNKKILAVFSNNPEKDQKNIKGITVCYPSKDFKALDTIYIIAVINDEYQRQMKKQLLSLNINDSKIVTLEDARYEYFSHFDKEKRKEHLSKLYKNEFGRDLNWEKPLKYSEILNYEKINLSRDIIKKHTVLADKLAVRKYVENRIGADYIPKLIGVWERADEIDYDKLPESFVLKCNHGSGMNIVVKNKKDLNWGETKQQLNEWVGHCYSYITGNFEVQYEGIPRRIYCEEYIDGMNSCNPQYNVFCFYGQPKWILRLRSPHTDTERGRFYNLKWETKDFYNGYPLDDEIVLPPESLSEVIEMAQKLSKGIRHVRVDIYELSDKTLKFSELTFTTWSGLKRFVPGEYDELFGELILDEPNGWQDEL